MNGDATISELATRLAVPLIGYDRADRERWGVDVGLGLFLDYLNMDAPSLIDAPTPVLIRELWSPDLLGKVRPFTSPRPRAIHRFSSHAAVWHGSNQRSSR